MGALRFGFAAILALAAGLPFGTATADGTVVKPPDPYVYVPPEVVPLTYNWTGFYIGGNIGAATTEHNAVHDHILNPCNFDPSSCVVGFPFFTSERFGIHSAGFAGGGFIGAQKQWSWLVLGVEAGYLWTDQSGTSVSAIEGSILASNPASGVDPTRVTSSMRDLFLVTGKFGWNWENILAYFKGGWANGEVDFRTSASISGALLTSSSGRENGWTAGAGIEYALWPHVIVGVEYDYVELNPGDRTRTQVVVGVGPVPVHIHAGLDTQSVTARLSYKFGGFGPEAVPAK
jgi:outer membrane immunogenic protein